MSTFILNQDEDLYVSTFTSTNIHCAAHKRNFRGISSLKKGDAFDYSRKGYWDNVMPRYEVVTSYYVDDPDDEIGCIKARVTYDPEI